MSYRIIYMGTPAFAVPALNALHAARHNIAAVYTQPPRPAGRGKKLQHSPVQDAAQALGVTVEHPVNFKSEGARETLAAYKPEIVVVAAYGLILPQAVLDMAPLGFLNIHGSILPRWRGAAPLQRAIEAGDETTGITIMQMEAGLDTGPMGLKRSIPIEPHTTAGALHDSLAKIGAEMIVEALDQLKSGTLIFTPQSEDDATYAAKIKKEEAALDFGSIDANATQRKIHALSPFPGAYVLWKGQRLKLLQVDVCDASGQPGETLDDAMTIACAHGAICPLMVQPSGKGPMPLADFLRGNAVPQGTLFGR